jgi:hypothetical protein
MPEAIALGAAPSMTARFQTSGVWERRIHDLIVEISPPVVADEMRTDIFVARILGRLRLASESVEECFCDFLLEIDPRKLADHSGANFFGKGFVANAE